MIPYMEVVVSLSVCRHRAPERGVGRSTRTYLEEWKREGIPLERCGLCCGWGEKQAQDTELWVFFGVTFGHIVLAILQSPRARGGENRKSKQRAHASGSFSCCEAARQFKVQLITSPLLTLCLLGHNALCGKKALQSPNWGKANANALFQNAAESMLLRG